MENTQKTPRKIYKDILIKLHKSALERGYIIKDAIMVEELLDMGFKFSADWLSDTEFYETFKGNMVGYYLGLCVNCFACGLSTADAWADGDNRLIKIKYDEIYEGGVWNNIFVLLEMTDNNERKDFQNFMIEMYEKWVVDMKDCFDMPGANEYISVSLGAFYQLGVTMRLDILGY